MLFSRVVFSRRLLVNIALMEFLVVQACCHLVVKLRYVEMSYFAT